MNEKVTILMATYNGEKYLTDQIESIIGQTYQNWKLFIRDDNSTDMTTKVIQKYCKIDSRITLIAYGDKHGSACRNFSELLNWAVFNQNPYIMFCDQDDVWFPNKVNDTLTVMLETEKNEGKDKPIMIYGRFEYIDEGNNIINKGFKFQKSPSLSNLLCDNYIYGCTSMLNLSLAKLSNPIIDKAVNHDYWIALIASCFGEIRFLDRILINYRQHSNNVSGNIKKTGMISRLFRYIFNQRIMFPVFKANIEMYVSFWKTFRNKMTPDQDYLFIMYFSKLKKSNTVFIAFLIKNKIFKADILRTLTFLFIITKLRKSLASGIQIT